MRQICCCPVSKVGFIYEEQDFLADSTNDVINLFSYHDCCKTGLACVFNCKDDTDKCEVPKDVDTNCRERG